MHIYVMSYVYLYSIEVTVSFNQRTYIVNENEGLLQAVLVLSKSVDNGGTTVQVGTNDNTATGEHLRSLNNILLVFQTLQEVLIMILDHTM